MNKFNECALNRGFSYISHKSLQFLSEIAVFFLAVGILLPSCSSSNNSIIDENIENAKQQIGSLLDSSEEGDEIRIPSTFKDGKIVFVPEDDWVSGFFAGTLWYMYELTGEEKWAEAAKRHTDNIEAVKDLKWHHDIGFMIGDSFGNGMRLKNVEGYDSVMVCAAKSLSTRYRPNAGVIQSWDADRGWQAKRGWKCPVIIDNMMNLELLFKATELTGDSTYYNIAVSHADQTMQNHFRPDYSCYHVVDYDPETGECRGRCTAQGYSDDSAWARGQAWALYGYATMYNYTKDPKYLEHSEKVAEYLFNNKNMPEDFVPYWDFDAPNIPNEYRDVSSAAVIASGLYDLYSITKKNIYKERADKIIVSLSSPKYRAQPGTNGGFILMHSVGSVPHNGSVDQPLNYADYYFLEALLKKRNLES